MSVLHIFELGSTSGIGGNARDARDASRRTEGGHVFPPMRHQSARITPDVGDARIMAAAPHKAAAPPTGSPPAL